MRTLQATLRAARMTGCQSNTMQAFAALIEQCKRLCAAVSPALRLAQAQVGPETGGHLNAAPRTNDSTRIARNR